ncbi:putative T7SS-secreted protein [Streptomyces sp. NPDC006670]|uniref:putative T7SS-secreted protein n=1 Tax=Streptomyces sp. NPDC006670 TaxID=3154476 RepID=UPI0033F1D2BE
MPDWGGLVDRGLEKVEDGWDATKKAVGEGVGKAAHGVGDVLDTVGAHDWADKVDDWGDDVASDLGATVGEQQLGQTRQADELVHGKPAVIQESVSHLMEFQAAFDRVGQGMRALDSGHWKGAAADAFREKFAMHPADWLHASDACRAAADALRYYGETVHWAQEQAGQAIELYEQGVKARKEWAEAYKTKAAAYTAAVRAGHDPGACPTPGEDPGEAARVRAQEILAEARRQRDDAAATAQQAVSTATEKAPAMPSASDRAWGTFVDYEAGQAVELNHFMGGVLKGTAGTLNFARGLNPYDAYNVTHPAEYAQHVNMTLAGLISTAVHPERVPGALLEPFKDDPSEGFGRLVPELLGTKGMGGARAATHVAEEAAESSAKYAGKNALKPGVTPAEPVNWSHLARPTDKVAEKAIHADSVSADEAAQFVNDRFPWLKEINNTHADGYTMNCSHNVVAVEQRLQGVEVSAAPRAAGEHVPPEALGVKGRAAGDYDWVNGYDDIIRDIEARGPEARSVVYIQRSDGSAHVFNAVNTEHGVVFLDGQSGTLATLEDVPYVGHIPYGGK